MVSYEFYRYEYGTPSPADENAGIPAEAWSFYSSRAEDQLDRYKRIYAVSVPPDMEAKAGDANRFAFLERPYAEAMAICAMADALSSFDAIQNGAGGPVSSASIGSVSVSYGNLAASTLDVSPKGQAKELYRCASKYLEIYRGVG